MAEVKIEQDGCITKVSVDGVPIKHARRVAVQIEPNSLPVVTLDLAAFQNALELSDARLKISGIDAPESVERAILAHLSEKYAPKPATIKIENTIGGVATVADVVAGMESIRRQIAAASRRAEYGSASSPRA